jgi:hypothetical protein
MFGLAPAVAIGAAVAFGLLLAALGLQTWRLDSAIEAKAALEVQLEDAGRKIEAQNKAVDKWAQAAELAKADKDKAVAAAAAEVRFHQSRADALRPPVVPATARSGGTPETSAGRGVVQPLPAGAERTAAAAVAKIRGALRP